MDEASVALSRQRPRWALIAPFFSEAAPSNRPRDVLDALQGKVNVVLVRADWDHHRKQRAEEATVAVESDVVSVRVPGYKGNVGVVRAFSHIVFALKVCAWFRRERGRIDLLYVTAPLNLAMAMVLLLAKRQRTVIDIVDLWPEALPFSSSARRLLAPVFGLWRALRRFGCRRADGILTVCDEFLEGCNAERTAGALRAKRVYLSQERIPCTVFDESPGRIGVAFVGNIGRLYDFETLVRVLRTQRWRECIVLHVVGEGDRRPVLLEALKKAQIAFEYYGVQYQSSRLGEILGRCRVGFNGYVKTRAAISYKACTYLAAGLPILNSMKGDLWKLVDEEGIGANYESGSSEGLEKGVERLLSKEREYWAAKCRSLFDRQLEKTAVRDQLWTYIRGVSETRMDDLNKWQT